MMNVQHGFSYYLFFCAGFYAVLRAIAIFRSSKASKKGTLVIGDTILCLVQALIPAVLSWIVFSSLDSSVIEPLSESAKAKKHELELQKEKADRAISPVQPTQWPSGI